MGKLPLFFGVDHRVVCFLFVPFKVFVNCRPVTVRNFPDKKVFDPLVEFIILEHSQLDNWSDIFPAAGILFPVRLPKG